MNVSAKDLKKLRPGEVKIFFCENPLKCRTAKSTICQSKVYETLGKGVVDLEYKSSIIKGEGCAIVVRALGERDTKVFKRKVRFNS